MSEIKVDTVKGRDGVVLLGDSGDTISVPSGATLTTTDATVNTGVVTATTESKTNKISPASGTAFTFGDSGDTFTVPSGVTFANSGTASGFGSGPVLIQSQTVGSAVAAVEFTSGIDSTYDEYMFVLINCLPSSDNVDFGFQTSTNNGSSYGVSKVTTSFRAMHNEADSQASLAYAAGNDYPGNPDTEKQWIAYGIGSAADEGLSGIIHFFAPSNTTYVKQFYLRSNTYNASVESVDFFAAGYWNTTSAIDAFRFAMFSGNIAAGTIKLYGVS